MLAPAMPVGLSCGAPASNVGGNGVGAKPALRVLHGIRLAGALFALKIY